MPKCSASVLVCTTNFGHDAHPAKKAWNTNKENGNTQASLSQPKASMFGMPLPRPHLALANGQDIRIPKPRPYIEEVEDDDREPAIDPLPFETDGPIIIEVLLSVGKIQDNDEDGTADCGGLVGEMEEENSEDDDEHNYSEHEAHQDQSWEAQQLLSNEAAHTALANINQMLKSPWAKGGGYKEC